MEKEQLNKDILVIRTEEKIMEANAVYAQQVRDLLKNKNVYCINMISSPGSGKTTLLVETLKKVKDSIMCAVIEGDQQTSNDAKRIAETGVPVIQVNTVQSCHLNAKQILDSIGKLSLDEIQLLIIENVGNLVCPASMDLGENEKVVLLSITEGEDKPEKYPLAFTEAHTMVITKMDLFPHLNFDMDACEHSAKSVNEEISIIRTSSISKGGLSEWINWLYAKLPGNLN